MLTDPVSREILMEVCPDLRSDLRGSGFVMLVLDEVHLEIIKDFFYRVNSQMMVTSYK